SILTVNPAPAAIAGTANICTGTTTTFTDATGGGLSWTSGNTSVANVSSSTGITNGLTAGTAPFTYTLGTGCIAVKILTVNGLPAAISGPATGCIGAVISLGNTVAGGIWSSSNTGVATIDGTGSVTG